MGGPLSWFVCFYVKHGDSCYALHVVGPLASASYQSTCVNDQTVVLSLSLTIINMILVAKNNITTIVAITNATCS